MPPVAVCLAFAGVSEAAQDGGCPVHGQVGCVLLVVGGEGAAFGWHGGLLAGVFDGLGFVWIVAGC